MRNFLRATSVALLATLALLSSNASGIGVMQNGVKLYGAAAQAGTGGGGGGGTTGTCGTVALNHGDSCTITGTGFGTNGLNFGFTGGSGGMIESTAAGVEVADSFPGYSMAGGSSGMSRGKKLGYDDATRGRVFTSTFDGSNPYPDAGAFTRDTGSLFALGETDYYSTWVYFTNVNAFSSGQIKIVRFTNLDDITDPNTDLYLSLANQASGFMLLSQPSTGNGTAVGASNPFTQNAWYRLEVVLHVQSVQNASTTQVEVRVWNGSAHPSNISFTFSSGANNNNMNIYPTASRSRYIIPQYYFGNGNTTGTVRQDDHYFQRSTESREELCDNATYSLTTHCEIEEPTAWSDTSLTIKINKGSFTSGTAYLHTLVGGSSVKVQSVTLQ